MPTYTLDPAEIAQRTPNSRRARRQQDGSWRACCPHCDPAGEHRDNLWITERGYNCHRCGKKGGLRELGEILGLNMPSPRPTSPVRDRIGAERYLKSRLGERAIELLEYRGIALESWEKHGLWVLSWAIGPRVRIRTLPNSGWNGPKTLWRKGEAPVPSLYGVEDCSGCDIVYLVEGEFDVWALEAAGGIKAFTFTLGASYRPTPEDIARIASAGIRTVRVLYDADPAGRQGGLEVAAALRDGLDPAKTAVELVRWDSDVPAGFDANDLCIRNDFHTGKVRAALTRLRSAPIPPTPADGFWSPPLDCGSFACPDGYVLSERCTYKIDQDENGKEVLKPIANQPVWIESVQSGLDSNEVFLTLATRWNGCARVEVVARDVAMNDKKLVALSRQGFPFDSLNAKAMVAYIRAAEAANRHCVPHVETVTRNGWRGADFILGTKVLGRDGRIRAVIPAPTAGIDPEHFECYAEGGTEAEWSSILPVLVRRPAAFVGVLAALASVLLKRLGAQGFGLEWFGTSSGGKTTSLRAAMSVWGRASIDDVPSWDATRFGVEARAHVCGNLPLFLDETKQSQGAPETIARIAYMLANGKGRTRSNKDLGVNNIKSWWLVAMWTGERTVRGMTSDTGIHPRVLAFAGTPFGDPEHPRNRCAAEFVDRIVAEHHGFAGPRFVRHLQTLDKDGWEQLNACYQQFRDELEKDAAPGVSHNFLARWSRSFAALAVAGRILAELYPGQLTADAVAEAVRSAWSSLCEGGRNATDLAANAMEEVLAWVSSQASDFSDTIAGAGAPPKRANLGKEMEDGLAITSAVLTSFLEEKHYDPEVVRNEWARRGWILAEESRKNKDEKRPRFRPVKLGGRTVRCIVITHRGQTLGNGGGSNDATLDEPDRDGGGEQVW